VLRAALVLGELDRVLAVEMIHGAELRTAEADDRHVRLDQSTSGFGVEHDAIASTPRATPCDVRLRDGVRVRSSTLAQVFARAEHARTVREAPNVGVIGASGYAGVELTRLLARHGDVRVRSVAADRWVGDTVQHRVGTSGAIGALRYASSDDVLERAADCAVVFLATPADASHATAPTLVARGVRVIDLSGAFRLRDATAFAATYGFSHAHPQLLAEAVYGLSEHARARIAGARLVANPGCYATAIQLALAPIVPLIGPGRIVVDAGSGVSGAGRSSDEARSFVEIYGDARAYRALRHQHAPEIVQGLAEIAGGRRQQQTALRLAFVSHLLPIARGILATCHAELAPGVDAAAVAAAYEGAYAREPFVTVAGSADDVGLRDVVGTNRCRIGFTLGDDGAIVVVAAIDNLVKGAAGQAIQNMNLVLGLEETAGLADLTPHHP
jgi:N-acetyl-gamma-glutamyl-phosphate reductase